MTIEEILKEWDKDSPINDLDLVNESLRTPSLHAKYYRIYMTEVYRLVQLNNQVKSLQLDKFEFYTQGPTSETPPSWELPPAGRIVKAEAQQYLDADKELIEVKTKLEIQKQKMKMIESIISTINFRSNAIKNAIDVIKFQAGS